MYNLKTPAFVKLTFLSGSKCVVSLKEADSNWIETSSLLGII